GDQRARVAAGYQRWLGDEAAAEAIGPRGLRPEALAPGIAADLAGWACAPAALFDWLRPRVTRRMLEHIATADYGIDYDQHLAAIADLCATGLVPRRLGWNPGEVVELRRWQEGTDVDHVERALCCTLLCLASDPALDTNGAILVESVVALGAEAMDLAAGLIAWCDARRRAEWAAAELDEEHDPWALVTLAVLAAARDPADARLPGLVALVTAHHRAPELPERRARSLRPRLWEELVARHVAPHAAQVPALADLLAILELRPPAEA
ncbi:MAG TPA: hypothetical protein VHE35_23320, partial [Kofleriaceae bacterium]|nr:hypothetical protein [Kofleriaceae bacterium]